MIEPIHTEPPPPPPPGAPGESPQSSIFPYATWGPWAAIGATVGALIAGLLLSLPFVFAGGDDIDDYGLFVTVAIQVCTGIGFLIVPISLASAGGGGLRDALGRLGFRSFDIPRAVKWVMIGVVSYFALSIIYSVVIGTPEQDDIAGDFGPMPVQILLIVLLAPIAEEVCFRGMLFGGIRTRLPLWAAAPAAGAVFGLLHYSTGWSAVPPLFILGTILCVVYEKSGSIWPVIAIHMFNNALALAVLSN